MRLLCQKMMKIHTKSYVQNCSCMDEMTKKQFVLTMLKMIEKVENLSFSCVFMHFHNMYVDER